MNRRAVSDPVLDHDPTVDPAGGPTVGPAGGPTVGPARATTAPDQEPLRPAPAAGFSMRPAMLVVGLAALIVVAFVAIGLATNGPAVQTTTSHATRAVPGSPLRAQPAAPALKVITQDGEPPPDILNAVAIPAGATRVAQQTNSAGADQFDAQIGLLSDASQGALHTFYVQDMKAQGWQVFDSGPADHDPGALEVLGKKAGSDGFYWEMGAVVSATTFGADAPPAGHTHFTVRLFQIPDPD